MPTFRTRQAPSPTGFLHLGTARTMLFTKLFALKNDGIYYLRLEDTDRNRLQKEAATSLVENLQVLGLSPDEGVNLEEKGTKDEFYGVFQSGKFGPYIQSERIKIYHQYAQELLDKKLAYWAYLTSEDKQELQEIKQATKKAINYFKVVSEKVSEKDLYASIQVALHDRRKPALMYKLQRPETIEFSDELLGKSKFDLVIEEDFVVLKSDGYPTYHFAHVIDDHLMETSLVIRAQEWFASLPKHITMFREIWEEVPKYIHLPVILGETGNKKMSKRDGNVNMKDYLDMGYLPEAIINYLAFLGWNPGTEKEIYLEQEDFISLSQQERVQKLIQNIATEFSIDKLSKSPARFNLEKLNWFNREYIKLLSNEEWYFFAKQKLTILDISQPQTQLALLLDKNRITTLSEFGIESDTILDWKKPLDDEITWKKSTTEESLKNLKEIGNWLQENREINQFFNAQTAEEFTGNTLLIEQQIKTWLKDNNKDTGSYLWPLRVTLSGKQKSPSPFELLAILTSDQIKERIETTIHQT
jgi:glutamyl-tRNA synthetase